MNLVLVPKYAKYNNDKIYVATVPQGRRSTQVYIFEHRRMPLKKTTNQVEGTITCWYGKKKGNKDNICCLELDDGQSCNLCKWFKKQKAFGGGGGWNGLTEEQILKEIEKNPQNAKQLLRDLKACRERSKQQQKDLERQQKALARGGGRGGGGLFGGRGGLGGYADPCREQEYRQQKELDKWNKLEQDLLKKAQQEKDKLEKELQKKNDALAKKWCEVNKNKAKATLDSLAAKCPDELKNLKGVDPSSRKHILKCPPKVIEDMPFGNSSGGGAGGVEGVGGRAGRGGGGRFGRGGGGREGRRGRSATEEECRDLLRQLCTDLKQRGHSSRGGGGYPVDQSYDGGSGFGKRKRKGGRGGGYDGGGGYGGGPGGYGGGRSGGYGGGGFGGGGYGGGGFGGGKRRRGGGFGGGGYSGGGYGGGVYGGEGYGGPMAMGMGTKKCIKKQLCLSKKFNQRETLDDYMPCGCNDKKIRRRWEKMQRCKQPDREKLSCCQKVANCCYKVCCKFFCCLSLLLVVLFTVIFFT